MGDLYDSDYEMEIATIIATKELEKSVSQGMTISAAKEKAQKEFGQTLQKRALNFLKNLEKKIAELSNKDLANLLLALLAGGLAIESEEELEYWISVLETKTLQRLSDYLEFASVTYAKEVNSKKKFTKNTKDFNSTEIEEIKELLQALKLAHKNKEPAKKDSEEYKKWLEKEKKIKAAEVIVNKDFEEKKKQEKQMSRQRNAPSKTETKEEKPDTLGIVKEKMLSAGVERSGEYWNDVISAHDASVDKISFAKNWSADYSRIEHEKSQENSKTDKINALRGLGKENETGKSSDQPSHSKSQMNTSANMNSMSSGNQGR